MYEAFRPRSVQELIFAAVSALPASQKNFGSWSQSWFIAGGISNHQIGYAVDVSLGRVISSDYMVSGRYRYPNLRIVEYPMPSTLHELSIASVVYTSSSSRAFSEGMQNSEPAMNLHRYCTDAGFSPLASEWWHFNDEITAAALTRQSDGRFYITEVLSVPPG
jgi:D-alanyl-D-alanine dipeptidase